MFGGVFPESVKWPPYVYRICLVLLWLFSGQESTGAQTPQLETWKKQYRLAVNKEQQYTALKHICEANYSLCNDSLLFFVKKGEKLFAVGSPQHRLFNRFYISYLGKTGDYAKAEKIAASLLQTKGMPIAETLDLQLELMRVRIRGNHAKDALDLGLKVLQQAENTHETNSIITSYTLIGWANMELEKYNEAIHWLEKGKAFTANELFFCNNPSLFVNLASCCNNTGRHKEAYENIAKGILYAEKGGNLSILANALNVRADMYISDHRIGEAQTDLERALQLREQIGDVFYLVSDLGQLAVFYAANKQPDRGIAAAQKGIALLRGQKQWPKLIYLHQALATNYKAAGRLTEATATLETILQLKDSLYRANSEQALAEIRGKYEMEKNRATIAKQGFQLSKSRYITAGALSLLVLCSLLFLSLWFNYKNIQKRKLSRLISEQENKSREAVLEAEENERKRIAANLHDNLGAHAGAIRSSIQYLNEGLGNRDEILQQLDHNAGEMVNHLNDTIWILKSQRLLLVNLSDRFKLWVRRLMVNFPQITYNFEEHISGDLEMSPQQVLHLFSILKESFYNAVKHSHCTHIEVSLEQNGHNWQFVLTDNGIGFDEAKTPMGLGIENIRYRAKENQWTVLWKVANNKGTAFTVNNYTSANHG